MVRKNDSDSNNADESTVGGPTGVAEGVAPGGLILGEAVYRAVFQASRDALLVADAVTGMLVDGNPAALELLGYSLTELRGLHQTQVHASEDIEAGTESFKNGQIAAGATEHVILRADGSRIPVEIAACPVRSPDGRKLVLGVFHDLRERRRALEHLRESEERFRTMADGCPAMVWVTDADGQVRFVNQHYREFFGTTYERVKGLGWHPLIHPDDLERCLFTFRNAVKDRVHYQGQWRVRRADGEWRWIESNAAPRFTERAQFAGHVGIAQDISVRKKTEIELAHQARHDHLTGLPNRLSLAESLELSMQKTELDGVKFAVVCLDLDGFKYANDTLGHDAGDVLLQQVAQRLRACVRNPDFLSRTGGDEFMIVCNELTGDQDVMVVAERMQGVLREPFRLANTELYLTASIGIAVFPRDGADVTALRSNADSAMYEAKKSGKDAIVFATPAVRSKFQERLDLDAELRGAIEAHQLSLHYQPIYEAKAGRLTAFEALLRWNHPVRGWISPSVFIPIAEESGSIFRLGTWVLREVCQQCCAWQIHGFEGIRVAVNVSAMEFARPSFTEDVLQILAETGVPGSLLTLELTETALMRDLEGTIERMTHLRNHGIRISIDDFGTGYSSLSYLPLLPADLIKIDRSFTAALGKRPEASLMMQGMISLARSIGKRVLVEGVETHEQLEMAQSMGVDEVQGFLSGRPSGLPDWNLRLSADEFRNELVCLSHTIRGAGLPVPVGDAR